MKIVITEEQYKKILIESTLKDTLNDLKINSGILFTFGTGIGAFIGPVERLLSGSGFSMDERDIILLIITSFALIIKDSEGVTLLGNVNEDIKPSEDAVKNICDSEKFCSAQGKITFGQLKAIVENASSNRLLQHVGEGGFKATLRLLPWFLPQLAIAGFVASSIRAVNKILRPALEETENYKTWWGRVVLKSFNLSEGELGLSDPLSRVFFISDGLMTMLNDKYKVKFARYISEIASEMPDDEPVPEFFVENELRHWLNDKFLLNPPLPSKVIEDNAD
jgi:hypothetical protein